MTAPDVAHPFDGWLAEDPEVAALIGAEPTASRPPSS